jgi:hypothetical protein
VKHALQIDASLKHQGTGRRASVIKVERFEGSEPLSVASGRYVLLIASERPSSGCTAELARSWIDAGASYVCAWGSASDDIEEAFDYASFLPELGQPLPFTLMTTSHKDEPLEAALWFAFYNAAAPDNRSRELDTVVVIVDSFDLELRCTSWIRKNEE